MKSYWIVSTVVYFSKESSFLLDKNENGLKAYKVVLFY